MVLLELDLGEGRNGEGRNGDTPLWSLGGDGHGGISLGRKRDEIAGVRQKKLRCVFLVPSRLRYRHVDRATSHSC